MDKPTTINDGSYLFQLEVLINAKSNGNALEHLLSILNKGQLEDYRVIAGIELGSVIEKALLKSTPEPFIEEIRKASALEARIVKYIESNQLIRLKINKGRGIKMNIPCRVVNFDSNNQLLTVYHVDEKQVYTVRINEIDDFID